MKRINALLLVFVIVLQLLVFNVSSAELITMTGMQYSSGNPSEKKVDSGQALIRAANPLGWKVSLPYLSGGLKLTYSTALNEAGILQFRLGSKTGEIIATLETEKIVSGWANYSNVVSFDYPITGDQEIWILTTKGEIAHGGAHWIIDLTFLEYEGDKTFAKMGTTDAFKDIADDPNKHEINLLADLGILSKAEAKFEPEELLTRLEFVSDLGKLLNAEAYMTETSPFKDVKGNDEGSDILSGLYQMGIIKGDTDGNFRPTSFITPQEAATVCTNALGYEAFSKDTNSVLDIVNSLGLFDGIKFTNKVTKSQAAKLIYNLLLADYLAVNEMNDTDIFYNSTKNFLEKATDYKHGKGVVTSNNVTKLYTPKKSEGISIDGILYEVSGALNADYLGALCEFFYHEESGTKILDAIRPLPKVEWSYVESTNDIRFDVISETEVKYTTISDDEEFEFELNAKTAIIYNGIALAQSLVSLIPVPSAFEGALTLIDNNADGILEAIWIDHVTKIIKVGAVSNGRIKDDLTNTVYDTNDKNFVLFKGSKSIFVDELSKGEILTVFESSNSGRDKYVRAVVSENVIKGTITQAQNGKYTIGDTEYRVYDYCRDDIYVGQSGEYVLDEYDCIVGCTESDDSDLKIGLYMAGDDGEATSLSQVASVKLFTDEGIEIFDVAQKVIADGVTVKKADDFYNGVGLFTGLDKVASKTPVIYRLNSSGHISMIDTINDGTGDKNDQLTNLLATDDSNPVNPALSDTFNVYNQVLVRSGVPSYGLRKDVKVFALNANGIEENYSIFSGYSLEYKYSQNLSLYSMERDSVVTDIIVANNYTMKLDVYKAPILVNTVTDGLDDKGNVVKVINGYTSGSKVSYKVDVESYNRSATLRATINSLEQGNLVRPFLTNDEITDLDLIYIPKPTSSDPSSPDRFGPAANAAGISALLHKDKRDDTSGKNRSATIRIYEFVSMEDEYGIVKRETKSGETWTPTYRLCNLSTSSVALCERNANGSYTFTCALPSAILVEGDIIVATQGEYETSLSQIYIFRDNSQ